MNHLIILPILWPLLVALLTMLPPFDQNLLLRRCLSVGGSAVLLLLSVLLVLQSTDAPAQPGLPRLPRPRRRLTLPACARPNSSGPPA